MSLMNYGFTKNKSGQSPIANGRSEASMVSEKAESNTQKSSAKPATKSSPVHKSHSKSSSKSQPSTPLRKTSEESSEAKLSLSMSSVDIDTSSVSPKKGMELSLPVQRVRMIMKSCPDVDTVPQEALHLITKATELFVGHLVNMSIEASSSSKLDYECLSDYVHDNEYLDFLKETVPKKITWAECQKLIEAKKADQRDLI